MNIFITGTDTDVGKTVVTAGISAVMQSLGYNMGVFKPVQSGAIDQNGFLISPDIQFVKRIDPNIKTRCSYNLKEPVAPSIAARLENIKIDKKVLIHDYDILNESCDLTVVEGAGGLLVPLFQDFLISDLIKELNLPLVIVARPDLGTINHTLLTINNAKNLGLQIAGVIINNYPAGTNDIGIKTAPKIIQKLSDCEILGIIPKLGDSFGNISPENLLDAVINNINLEKLFNIKIPKLSQC